MADARAKGRPALWGPEMALPLTRCATWGKSLSPFGSSFRKNKSINILGVRNSFLSLSQLPQHSSSLSANFKFSYHLKPTGLCDSGSCEPRREPNSMGDVVAHLQPVLREHSHTHCRPRHYTMQPILRPWGFAYRQMAGQEACYHPHPYWYLWSCVTVEG